MKSLVILVMGLMVTLTSCVSRSTAERVENQRDSLETVVMTKDSLLSAVFNDINAIAENLALIKTRENIITVSTETEGVRRPATEINNDIAAIDRLLQENKSKIASLQYTAGQLRKANVKITGLEKTISNLNLQLNEKNKEVAQLRDNLSQMGIKVEKLTEEVAERSTEVKNLGAQNVGLENQLNTVHYVVGLEKELRDAQIVNKQGFIGRTLTVNKSGNIESFTTADARLLQEVAVGHKKVTVVTTHPEGSYELVTDADKVVVKLVIKDSARFWESSKILVISYR